MKSKKYNLNWITLILINILILFPKFIYSNNNKMVQIYSTYQSINILTNIINFKDNVILKCNNIKLYADTITMMRLQDNQDLSMIEAFGNPVILYCTSEKGSMISAQSLIMRYDTIDNSVTLTGKACIKQSGNIICSDKIIYSINQKKIQAFSEEIGKTSAVLLIKVI